MEEAVGQDKVRTLVREVNKKIICVAFSFKVVVKKERSVHSLISLVQVVMEVVVVVEV